MSWSDELKGKVAVVTGGASGIGKGIATRLVEHGMKVVVADVEESALRKTEAEIDVIGIQTDVTDPQSMENLAKETQDRCGGVHLVCNNAGVGSVARISDMTLNDWKWVLDVNLWGVIHGIHYFLPLLRENPEGGHIVNTSSLGGLGTMPTLGGYAVSKFGVVALSETLAMELAEESPKIGVTILCPGPVRTNIATSARNRPKELPGALHDHDLEKSEFGAIARWIEPVDVGDIVVRAVKRGDLYAFTHPEMGASIEQRHAGISSALQAWARDLDIDTQ